MKRIGFVSTRLAGTDGVSLETAKWAEIFERDGHACFYMAGELDTPAERSFLVPKCHFTHPEIKAIYEACFEQPTRAPEVTRRIEDIKHELAESLRAFVEKFDIDLLVPENAVTIPLNLPLGLAITEFAAETRFPILAHHHDFFWERKRFLQNACWDYLNQAFPPHLPNIVHTVLNSSQDNQLSLRTGISAAIIPNIMDFANPPPLPDGYAIDIRDDLGIGVDEKFILQPTRIVQRKGIEHAIELVHRLEMPAVLVISHAAGDEGDDYALRIREYADLLGVKLLMCTDRVSDDRAPLPDGTKTYTLADLYRHADLVTYPSTLEGFGNGFLEALYYRRPIVVNNYSIYHCDIGPKGFRVVEMDEYVSKETVRRAREVLGDPALAEEMVEHNYRLGNKFFSYEVAAQKLRALFTHWFGSQDPATVS